MELKVLTSLDALIPFNKEKIEKYLLDLTEDLDNGRDVSRTISEEAEKMTYSDIEIEQLLELLILVSTQNIQNDLAYDTVATRLLLVTIYRSALKDHENSDDFLKLYQENFVDYIQNSVDDNLLHRKLTETYSRDEIVKISKLLDPEMDMSFKYFGLDTALKRYMKTDWHQKVIETPQYMWMRIAMWMALEEESKLEWIEKFYKKLSTLEYIPGGSTNIGAGSTYPKLSNCYIIDTEDDTVNIFENVKNIALISKATGGLGISISKLRASGSPVKSNNTHSTGPIPFAKVMDTTLKSMARAGKKHGAMCIYMENWHYDFPEFVDLRQTVGDDYRRLRTANTAVYISDEFMQRVVEDKDWYLFDPADTPDLTELYGKEFSERYEQYIKEADEGKIERFRVVKAKDQFRQILTSLVSNSHPWLTWKDSTNVRALNNNTGTIHSLNLCTEICLPQDKENIAVCNLAYINLARHTIQKDVKSQTGIDWDRLEESVKITMRHLDNIIDVNDLTTVPEAENSDQKNRAVGLGMSGLAELFEQFGYAYDSEEAYELTDKVTEFISYQAIEASHELAKEKGSYDNFEGSLWSKGMVPLDTLKTLEDSRDEHMLQQDQSSTMDWDSLRSKVKKGMRNATVMAIAPNASTGIVLGTSPGIDVRFSQIFSRATSRGKFLDINHNLVNDLQELGLWEELRDRVIQNYGDISQLEEIPQELRDVYKTSFQVSPFGVIEVASRAQKWIDQAMSRNMYLETRQMDELMKIYTDAWRKGLKSTYYLHTKPRHTAEQSNMKVNKSATMKQSGFAGVLKKRTQKAEPVAIPAISKTVTDESGTLSDNGAQFSACPTDPAEREACDSCQ